MLTHVTVWMIIVTSVTSHALKGANIMSTLIENTAKIEIPIENTKSKISSVILNAVGFITMWGVVATTVILLSFTWV